MKQALLTLGALSVAIFNPLVRPFFPSVADAVPGLHIRLIADAHANGIVPPDYPDAALVNTGRDLFFNETFDGNGRTCGTCHPEDNNHTLDPRFIASLPADDPLFVAERDEPNPLAHNFENPALMHEVGLILENTNGFDDLEQSFTMRSVPHLLALRTSITPPTDGNDGTTLPPDERVGWGGDGAPATGQFRLNCAAGSGISPRAQFASTSPER